MPTPQQVPPGAVMRIRRLTVADVAGYRELRLRSLREHPEAFSASPEVEAEQPEQWFAERLTGNLVFAAVDDEQQLIGMVGLHIRSGPKQRHKGLIWGMYVRNDSRREGIGDALLTALLREAELVVEDVRLEVVAANTPAVRLFERAGFTPYGMEPRALRVSDTYYETLLLTRSLRPA